MSETKKESEKTTEKPSLKNMVIKNTFWVYFFSYLGAPIGYLIRIIYSRTLSIQDYGLFYSILGLFALLGLFNDLGFSETLNYYGIRFFEKKKFRELKLSIYYAFMMQLLSSFILSSIMFFSAEFLAKNYFHAESAYLLLRPMLIYFIFMNLIKPFITLFKIKQDIFKSTLLGFLRQPFVLALSLLVFVMPNIYLALSIAWGGSYLLLFILGWLWMRLDFRELRSIKVSFDTKLYKKLFNYASVVMVGSGASFLLSRIDVQLITYFKGLTEVAYYSNAFSIANLLPQLVSPINVLLFPLVTKLVTNNDIKRLNFLLSTIYKLVWFIGLPFLVLFFVFPKEILFLIYGSKYTDASFALLILSIGFFFSMLSTINFSVLAGFGEVKKRVKISYMVAIVNIIGDLLLIPKFGYLGAAVFTTISFVLMFILTFIGAKWKLSFSRYFFIKIFFLNIIFFLVVYLLKEYLKMYFLLEASIIGVLSFSIYFLLGYFIKLYDVNFIKKMIYDFLNKN